MQHHILPMGGDSDFLLSHMGYTHSLHDVFHTQSVALNI